MQIFVHIPKTAGTALGYAFEHSMERKIFWDYDQEYRYFTEVQEEIVSGLDFIDRYFKMIFGHFFVSKYEPYFPEADHLTCIRHPVNRIVSQYFHVGYEGVGWQGEAIRNGKMNVIEFAQGEMIASAQSRHLAGRAIEDFKHIFITERLAASVRLFHAKTPFRFRVPIPTLNTKEQRGAAHRDANVTATSSIVEVTEEDRRKVFQLCGEDNELYQKAVELHKKELSRLS